MVPSWIDTVDVILSDWRDTLVWDRGHSDTGDTGDTGLTWDQAKNEWDQQQFKKSLKQVQKSLKNWADKAEWAGRDREQTFKKVLRLKLSLT